MPLNLNANINAPDTFYQALIDAHQDLSDEQSREMNAALILVLANHIGETDVLNEALAVARQSVQPIN
ncbi:DUF2783 domain-containing protein [Bordetella holmesii]|uniref:PF10932 family protein n=2 Tax=Bordetella holmesii TaxID=35814 RepID=A0A158M8I3_9BORD|nr:DUF2783 domain-containing protein [Bordetella holmesii]AHV94676.1 hypothetical protein D560_0453 [Bordetella holmesii ATCC 51541]AIT25140.1 hypothetical protein D558_0451 [Bordetella holmesii 44057]EWM45706.1 hypothetical protein D557_3714 [Bordetella holmesii 70147]EWM48402.1 hypothetical protein D556_0452 [Bordetella holmesii 41130]EWM49828.1 hypothetical protein D555_0456 [Bordetella holmesii 35009]